MKRILLVLCFFVFNVMVAYTQVLTQDSLALVALYNATNGADWTDKKPNATVMNEYYHKTWLQKNVSEWLGVVVVNNRVKNLDLSYASLTGTLPEEFFDLTGLVDLNISRNALTGNLSSRLENLVNLRILDITYNRFSGDFPPSVTRLSNLEFIFIMSNNFKSFPDVTTMTKVGYVQVQLNDLTFEDIIPMVDDPRIVYNPQKFVINTSTPLYDLEVFQSFSLSITLEGEGNLYQWQHSVFEVIDNERFSGSQTNTLVNTSAKEEDDGFYSCLVTNPRVPDFFIKVLIDNRVTVTDHRLGQTISIRTPDSMFCGDTISLVSVNSSGLPITYRLTDGTPLAERFAPARNTVYDIIAYHNGNETYKETQDTLHLRVLTHRPVAVFAIDSDLPVYWGEDLTLSVQQFPDLTYSWTSPGGQTSVTAGIKISSISANQEGIYTVSIRNGSCLYDSLSLTVILSKDAEVIIYELITPNGDGDNETFYIKNIEQIPAIHVTIYNHANQVVYYNENYSNDWNGENLPVGVYYYLVQVEKWDKVYRGNLYIKR